MGSVGERASKLLAVKAEILKKNSATSAIPAVLCVSLFGPVLSSPSVKSFLKFDGQ